MNGQKQIKLISRRSVLVYSGLSLAGVYAFKSVFFGKTKKISGSILGQNYKVAHSLRTQSSSRYSRKRINKTVYNKDSVGESFSQAYKSTFKKGTVVKRKNRVTKPDSENVVSSKVKIQIYNKQVVIVGGGIAGLSAAWWLKKNNINDIQILELSDREGGNSISGQNKTSKYPWGAHYIPTPGDRATLVHELFAELGIIKGKNKKSENIYNDLYVCSDLKERLYFYGKWQAGLIPESGLGKEELKEIDRFNSLMDDYSISKGVDNRYAFNIPLEESSSDEKFLSLDRLSMFEFLQNNNFKSKHLLWYVEYCCRDDYGTTLKETSAWAGVHYFASRVGKGENLSEDDIITWPEGNSFLVNGIKNIIGKEIIKTNSLVTKVVQNNSEGGEVIYKDIKTGENFKIKADHIILATPRFVTKHIFPELQDKEHQDYTPWMVANISLNKKPSNNNGAPLAWDNVFYNSDSLGYVVATHQDWKPMNKETVLTYYWPLTHKTPLEARKWAMTQTHEDWVKKIVADLKKPHPEIESNISNIDVWVWGHAMIRPEPGFIWGKKRKAWQKPQGRIHFAHSDLSGISIFEEAQYHGVRAAKEVLGV